MASVIKLSFHRRLFVMLIAFSWSIILCFIGFQYMREKQYKSDYLSLQLQLYNRHLLEAVEDGEPYETYIATHHKPFDDLRISMIDLSGVVVYDNMLPVDSLDNHRMRPEVSAALKKGSGYHIGRQSTSDGVEYFYSATRGRRLIVRTAIPYSASLRELLQADWTFLGVMISISLAMSVLAYFVTRRLGKNMERLNRFAAKAEKGEAFDEEEPFPNDELGSISNHIVQLYAQWQQTIKDRDIAYQATLREEQEKMRIKRQLTNNINHELKTPVASIRGALETILMHPDMPETQRRQFLERAYHQAGRLSNLVEDISTINKLDEHSTFYNRLEVDIYTIVDNVVADLSLRASQLGACITHDVPKHLIISGNYTLLYSIFHNIVDNALNYVENAQIHIQCTNQDPCEIA